jgi:hypothetical protein
MLRKTTSVLLVFLLLIISGIDLLEDLDLPIQAEIDSPTEGDLPTNGNGPQLVNNILESGTCARPSYGKFFEVPAFQLSVEVAPSFGKVLKIHKLHCVFLI